MSGRHIGILHPGAMGISIAASARDSGQTVHWLSSGRGAETRSRAEQHRLLEVRTLQDFCAACTLIISVCPPAAATSVAEQVLSGGFQGLYVDANAISPERTKDIARAMDARGVAYVDGGIIGPPAWQPGTTVLCLSGTDAPQVADCFSAGPLAVEVIGAEPGRASALKMCFAANTKGTTALLGVVLAAAERLGVRAELERQWSRQDPDHAARNAARVRRDAVKAWRFTDEMREIEATLTAAGLPGGFHAAAADAYGRQAGFKGAVRAPALEDVLAALLTPASGNKTD